MKTIEFDYNKLNEIMLDEIGIAMPYMMRAECDYKNLIANTVFKNKAMLNDDGKHMITIETSDTTMLKPTHNNHNIDSATACKLTWDDKTEVEFVVFTTPYRSGLSSNFREYDGVQSVVISAATEWMELACWVGNQDIDYKVDKRSIFENTLLPRLTPQIIKLIQSS